MREDSNRETGGSASIAAFAAANLVEGGALEAAAQHGVEAREAEGEERELSTSSP